jgi:RHS repeat-associated protein
MKIKDEQEEIQEMQWRPDGKLESVTRSVSSGKLNLNFDYDVSGNRIAKHVVDNNGELLHSTYYVRDAQGNVMSVYKLGIDTVLSSLSYAQKERHIYGSSMLGMDTDSLELISPVVGDTTLYSYLVGNKRYQMSNHLGNVLAVISDKKLPVPVSGLVSYYLPEIVSTSDYSPFGVELEGRNFNSEKFRYGFNGKEKDDEVKGSGNHIDFGARGYDPRKGRWLSVDPLAMKYPQLSPFNFVGNMPIIAVDPDGRYIYFVTANITTGKPEIQKANFETIANYLNSTEDGKALLAVFIDNPDRDLYVTIGNTQNNKALHTAYFDKNNKVGEPPMTSIGKNKYFNNLSETLENFEGVLVVNPKAEIQFIILDEKYLGKRVLNPADEPYIKTQTKAFGHELGSHAKNPSGNETKDHHNWGQDGHSHSKDVGTGEAKSLNTQINKLKRGDVKNDLKTKEQSHRSYKLERDK